MSDLKFDETRVYLLEQRKPYHLMSEKYEKICKYLNCVEEVLILVSTVTGRVSASEFVLLVCVPVGFTSSAVGIKICAITAIIVSISQL